MKITFPHMGNVYIAAKALFDCLEIDYVMPPLCNKKDLEIGSLFSPEEMCLPFKIQIGNYVQSIEKGADTVIITGSCGPCRFGEYCELQMNLLNKLGKKVDFIVLESPFEVGPKEFLRRISSISKDSKKSRVEKIKALYYAYKVMDLIDELEENAYYLAGFEKKRGTCKRLLNDCKREILNTSNTEKVIYILKNYNNKLKGIEKDSNVDPVKIAIIGEIYTVIEPYSNLYVQDKLMDYGVSTKRRLSPSWWFKDALMKTVKLNSISLNKAADEYLKYQIGGHARECVGEAVLSIKEGYDGAIQIFPMGCMPEIVSKSILQGITKDNNFPILTLIVDEMTGEAGYQTRLEAFIDLLERRKKSCII